MRLNKFIANNSQFSRRKADTLIEEGKVFINDKKVEELGVSVDPEHDTVKVGEQLISVDVERVYIALNKPSGYICTRSDEHQRETVMALVPTVDSLKPIGRLDKDSEGLLLFSNDGEFINRYTHPKFECEKEYFVKIEGQLNDEEKKKLENGIVIDGKTTSKAKIRITKESTKESQLKIIIHEGRNRQIRKMFASIKHPVKYLQRIRIGKIDLFPLRPGKYRHLTKKEIDDI